MIKKKTFLISVYLLITFVGYIYAEDALFSGDIFDEFPKSWEMEDIAIFEPDPDDLDGDGLLNLDEEYHNTDPYDPDTDNDGLTDLFEIGNGLDPNSLDTIGYLEVEELEPDNDDLNNQLDDNNDDDPSESEIDYDPVPPENDSDDTFDDAALNETDESNESMMRDVSSTTADLMPVYMLLLLNDDSDSDGLLDDWEIEHFGNIVDYDGDDDPDVDNLNNLGEYSNQTDPNDPDSDDDGLTDGFEIVNGLNPNDIDTDDDSLEDGWEVTNGFDPADPDMDDDGLNDGQEITYGTDPEDPDTDDDELPDLWEVTSGTNPLVYDRNDDPDSDLYSNYIEYVTETDPINPGSSPVPGQYNKYDKLGRLTNMTSLIEYQIEYEIIFEYDSVGNRVKKTVR